MDSRRCLLCIPPQFAPNSQGLTERASVDECLDIQVMTDRWQYCIHEAIKGQLQCIAHWCRDGPVGAPGGWNTVHNVPKSRVSEHERVEGDRCTIVVHRYSVVYS